MRKRIEEMFRSGDQEMVKLAQKLCHHYRINYWVGVYYRPYSRGRRTRGGLEGHCIYSLEEDFWFPYKSYRIVLDKSKLFEEYMRRKKAFDAVKPEPKSMRYEGQIYPIYNKYYVRRVHKNRTTFK